MAKGKPIKQVTPPTRARSGRPSTRGGGKRNIPFVNKTFFGPHYSSVDNSSSTSSASDTRRPRRIGMQD